MLSDIQKKFYSWKANEICYKKYVKKFLPHLKYVAVLPWEVRRPNLLQTTNDTTEKNMTHTTKTKV